MQTKPGQGAGTNSQQGAGTKQTSAGTNTQQGAGTNHNKVQN
nr:hypothetical protein [Mycoplasmopsis bovis]